MTPSPTTDPAEARLTEVLAIHFDPVGGAPYWLERAEHLGFDPRREIRRLADLPKMGTMRPEDLRSHPLEHFIPRSSIDTDSKRDRIVARTGGTLGRPVWTAYSPGEFEEAFVEPFVTAARHVGFPEGENWLYVGPSGPHVIGRAADHIARRTGSPVPFSVDFDSRWAKKLPHGSFAAGRYLTHIVDQAMAVLERQTIGVLFTTPPVLTHLADRMSRAQRDRIRGVHYGGVALEHDQLARFQREHFPNAIHLSGYGNTLFGCCLELSVAAGRSPTYYPLGGRLIFGVIGGEDGEKNAPPRYGAIGAKGRLVFSRLDRTMLLLNMVERDEGRLTPPPPDAPPGFALCGVAAPRPARDVLVPNHAAVY